VCTDELSLRELTEHGIPLTGREQEEGFRLPACNHIVGIDCLKAWIESRHIQDRVGSCPVCRVSTTRRVYLNILGRLAQVAERPQSQAEEASPCGTGVNNNEPQIPATTAADAAPFYSRGALFFLDESLDDWLANDSDGDPGVDDDSLAHLFMYLHNPAARRRARRLRGVRANSANHGAP